ncbi:Serine/threonine-protein kinase 4 [Chionoecetes opilio]|uniref:Serine/threonine-protein kinase 4 n=1 Tax=Chionoecetes opilio TaxID=41210 RepID=A0A8J5CR99_CHIOP|nr:Serine/threonine-protein kinase 4 [Chionoecetes opilio]
MQELWQCYKALHKESGQVLAIKQVPIDTDLQEIIKEISIMQQCDSHHVVKYYGPTSKTPTCGHCAPAKSRHHEDLRKRRALTEEDDRTVGVYVSLMGLAGVTAPWTQSSRGHQGREYPPQHSGTRQTCRLRSGGATDTMAKRNTVIGTPFWMAPEVIQEIGYDCVADI